MADCRKASSPPRSDGSPFPPGASPPEAEVVAHLDEEYQAAVARGDAGTMARILSEDFVLVTGSGKTYTREDLLAEAREGRVLYTRQDDEQRTVRLWKDAAVVSALLTAEGTEEGRPFAYRVWFSDVYLRTPEGWRYVLGQSGARLPR